MKQIRCTIVMLVMLFVVNAANAMTVELDHPRVAVKINRLQVLGDFYDVEFNNIVDSTFVGDPIGATAARDAIIDALNGTTADLVRILNTGSTVNNFGVMDSGGSTVRGVSFSVANNWQPQSSTVLAAPIAQFTLSTAIPEPSTAALGILAFAGLATRRRVKKA